MRRLPDRAMQMKLAVPDDSSCVALLRSAGALIFGKTITCEFAGVTAGPTTNPHDQARTPGGSSSGSGAAVADFTHRFRHPDRRFSTKAI